MLCQSWGQPYGLKSSRRYRAEPDDWHVLAGQRRSQTRIAFAFKRGGVDATWEVHTQRCCDAVENRQATPPDAWSCITLLELEVLATGAAESLSLELGVAVSCEYLGQPYGSAAKRRYRRDPLQWHIAAGSWHSQQTIAFAWKRPGQKQQTVTEQHCNHACRRGAAAPEDWPCVVLWAETQQELELAASAAGEEINRTWQEEFGNALSCRYSNCAHTR